MDIFSDYYKEVFQRPDIIFTVKELLQDGTYQALADPVTIQKYAQFMIDVVQNETVRSKIMDKFIDKHLGNTISYFYKEN